MRLLNTGHFPAKITLEIAAVSKQSVHPNQHQFYTPLGLRLSFYDPWEAFQHIHDAGSHCTHSLPQIFPARGGPSDNPRGSPATTGAACFSSVMRRLVFLGWPRCAAGARARAPAQAPSAGRPGGADDMRKKREPPSYANLVNALSDSGVTFCRKSRLQVEKIH